MCYWETHQEASIRSLGVNENQDLIVTGGKDGGLSIWPLSTNEVLQASKSTEIQFSNTFSIKKVQDVPRRILLSNSGRIWTVTNAGVLFAHDGSNWNCVVSDARFASYCLFQISEDRQCVCLASISGDVMILKGELLIFTNITVFLVLDLLAFNFVGSGRVSSCYNSIIMTY